MVNKNINDRRLRNPTPYFFIGLGVPPIRGQNIKFIPIFLLLTSNFMFYTYQSLKKKLVWVRCGGGGCMVGGSIPWPKGFGQYTKHYQIEKYSVICLIHNCYVCNMTTPT